jgi:hypothetical protein
LYQNPAAELAQLDRIRAADEAYREMSREYQEATREQFTKTTPVAAYAREFKEHGLGGSGANLQFG